MKIFSLSISFVYMLSMLLFSQCTQKPAENQAAREEAPKPDYGGFESQVAWGEHLVIVSACHDCHSPKKMTDHGPDIDSALLLSGHPAQLPPPDVNQKDIERKGFILTSDLTAWVGPWGISYTANLTSDASGIGNWSEEQFIYALRHGKLKGLEGSRELLPPMPWQMYRFMSDDEFAAVFAYLKTLKPINNLVPPPIPPAK